MRLPPDLDRLSPGTSAADALNQACPENRQSCQGYASALSRNSPLDLRNTPWINRKRRVPGRNRLGSGETALYRLKSAWISRRRLRVSRRRRVSSLSRRGSVERGGLSGCTPRFFAEPARLRPARDGSRDSGLDPEKPACLAQRQDGFRALQLGSRHTVVLPAKLNRSKVGQKDSSLSATVSADDATVSREPRCSPRIRASLRWNRSGFSRDTPRSGDTGPVSRYPAPFFAIQTVSSLDSLVSPGTAQSSPETARFLQTRRGIPGVKTVSPDTARFFARQRGFSE